MRVLLLVMLGVAGLLAGCSPTDVVLATLPGHGDGGPEGHRCGNNGDCHDEEFCARDTCEQTSGRCQARPVALDSTKDVVCGCDGVTYWNDRLRQQVGVTAMNKGSCGPGAATCGGTAGSCPVAGASCARIFSSACPHSGADALGVCVFLPPDCPPPAQSDHLAQCNGAAPGPCEDECAAMRSEKPHLRPVGGLCP